MYQLLFAVETATSVVAVTLVCTQPGGDHFGGGACVRAYIRSRSIVKTLLLLSLLLYSAKSGGVPRRRRRRRNALESRARACRHAILVASATSRPRISFYYIDSADRWEPSLPPSTTGIAKHIVRVYYNIYIQNNNNNNIIIYAVLLSQ